MSLESGKCSKWRGKIDERFPFIRQRLIRIGKLDFWEARRSNEIKTRAESPFALAAFHERLQGFVSSLTHARCPFLNPCLLPLDLANLNLPNDLFDFLLLGV